VRGTLVGSAALTLPRQTVTVAHSIGLADGIASGEGSFAADASSGTPTQKVDYVLHLTTPGFGPVDMGPGGGIGGAGVVDYHVYGDKM
jgi:hypothetical protein